LGVFSARRDSIIILIFILFFLSALVREREGELNIVVEKERVLDNNE
jgi:hypothetical protein